MKMLDSIPDAIQAIQQGEVIIVVDDEDRENEGDFLVAARHATPEVVNFMANAWTWTHMCSIGGRTMR